MTATSFTAINYQHRHTAHCETGAGSGLFSHHGLKITEAMVFGIGSGLFFAYMPLLKVGSLPLTSYRMPPGYIFRKAAKRLGVQVREHRFRNEEKAMAALDQLVDVGTPVGCQTGVFWLPYFPESLRFHFNAHNIVIYGREGDEYLISDPVIDEPMRCHRDDLARARFAKGPLAPKGRMYHIESVPAEPNLKRAVVQGLKSTCFIMSAPAGPIGARGPRYLAWAMERWPKKHGERRAAQLLAGVVRMQEEIGTGGGGFRFIFAAFLQEAAELFEDSRLIDFSKTITEIGDRWREFAMLSARHCKGRGSADDDSFRQLADILRDCASRELELFAALRKHVRSLKMG